MNLKYVVISAIALQLGWYGIAQADTVSHWPMNGTGVAGVGDTVPDVVGSNDGMVVNDTLTYVAGPPESPGALAFDNNPNLNKIDVPDDASLHFDLDADDFTLETVFRVADGVGGRPAPFAKNGSAAADSQYWARVRADQTGGVQFLVRGDGGDGPGGTLPPERNGTTIGSVTDGKWHHFAVVYSGGDTEMHLYLDHVLDSSFEVDPTDGIIGANAEGLIIGGFTSSTREFEGSIADMRISNMALSPNEFLPVPTTIPEPGSMALVLLGAAAMSMSRVRRR